MSWRLGAGDEVALYPLWPLTIWHLAMLARGIKDGIVKNCAGGDLAGGKAAHDIADLVGRAQMGGTVIATGEQRSDEHKSELQSLMRISYAVFCLKKKQTHTQINELKTMYKI